MRGYRIDTIVEGVHPVDNSVVLVANLVVVRNPLPAGLLGVILVDWACVKASLQRGHVFNRLENLLGTFRLWFGEFIKIHPQIAERRGLLSSE